METERERWDGKKENDGKWEKSNLKWDAERKRLDNRSCETQPTWFAVAPASTKTWPWHRLYPSHSWLSWGYQRSMSGWSVRGRFKRLASTDTVKVIHPGLEEHHLFAPICQTDIHWEDLQPRHIRTRWGMGCIYSADHSITSFKKRHVRRDNSQLHCLSVIWVTGSKDKRSRSSSPLLTAWSVFDLPQKNLRPLKSVWREKPEPKTNI